MTNSTERRATFADLRAGMLARIGRPRFLTTGPGLDDDELEIRPIVQVLADPTPCTHPSCEALITTICDIESGATTLCHQLPTRPVIIEDSQS